MTEVETLKKENHRLQEQLSHYVKSYNNLYNLFQEFRRNRFGKKSERVVDEENPQLSLFSEKNLPKVESSEEEEVVVDVPAHKRRSKPKKDLSNLPRKIETISIPESQRHCACGCEKVFVRYETKELLNYIPAQVNVIEQRREVLACKKGCKQSIQTAPAPKHILPKSKCTESLLAYTIVSKLHHRQPLYHLEKYGDFNGLLTRKTMAKWHIDLIKPLFPLYNLMKDTIIDYDVASLDATSLQVLNEPGRNPETKSYMYCMRGGPPDKPVVLYAYYANQHKQFVDQWFEGFSGSVHMDADPFFTTLLEDDGVFAAKCNAHARRYFEKITKQIKDKKNSLAYEAVGYFRKMYQIEREAKNKKMSAQQRNELRLEKTQPILDELNKWLHKNLPNAIPKSPLATAMKYTVNHWQGLTHFMTDGRLEVDNNLTEQEIKPFVIARKNFMFANSVNGANALAMHFSFVRTAIANKLNPFNYYEAILKQLPHCQSVEELEKLLPWNIEFK